MRRMLVRVLRWAVLASSVAVCVAGPASAATFNILAGCSTGCAFADTQSGSAPVSGSRTGSSEFGTSQGSAAAGFGSVGAGSNAIAALPNLTATALASAGFIDTVVFSKTNPNAGNQFLVSLNLAFAGILNAGAPAAAVGQALVDITVGFFGQSELDMRFHSDGVFQVFNSGNFGGTGTIASGAGGFNSLLTTVSQLANVGPTSLSLSIAVSVFTQGTGGSATSDFSNTLEVPTGIDVFNLPDGYTANAGDWLVNNRFVDVNAVPLPPAVALFASGLGVMGLLGWRRKRKGAAIAA